MLAFAAKNIPQATLVQQDMTKFSLDTRFDVAICMFDTLNHLPRFESWLEVFERVHEHLVEGGLFIFDVNTLGRLRGLGHQPPYVQEFGENTLIMNITPGEGDVFIWDVQIFEGLGDDMFRLHQESILELGVPLERIRASLARNFDLLEEADLDGGPPSEHSNRVFFAFRHRG
jgi:SAM-dependent methyltransferase